MIQRQKSFSFRENTYIVEFPNVGKLIDAESLKQSLTSNRYGVMTSSGIKTMYTALDLVDAIVFFSINCPSIKKVLSVKEFTDIPFDEGVELVKLYQEQILPWYNESMKGLYEIVDGSKNNGQD